MSDEGTAIFFPLRSSVELFVDPRSPTAVVRAKEAACLYDHLIFEPGLLDVTIASHGSMPWWFPPDQLTPERRERARRPIPLDSPVSIAIGKQPGPGVPAPPEEMHAFSLGTLAVRYVAEFHTGILDELRQFDVDWVSLSGGGSIDRSDPVSAQVANEIDALNRQDRFDKTLMPNQDDWVRRYVWQSFNRDAVIASELGAAFCITPLFAEMVERRGVQKHLAGADALRYVVPNLGCLPWEAVLAFRDHQGSQEARSLFREFERRAQEDVGGALEYGQRVAQQLTDALFGALEAQRSSLPQELATEALLGAVDLVPGVGPLASKSASAAQKVRKHRATRAHWTSALMLLRQPR